MTERRVVVDQFDAFPGDDGARAKQLGEVCHSGVAVEERDDYDEERDEGREPDADATREALVGQERREQAGRDDEAYTATETTN